MRKLFVTVFVLMSFALPVSAEAASNCGVVDHRAGAGLTIDDNTLEGLARDALRGYVSEIDGRVLVDGFTIFHENRWEQYTTGVGTPETSTVAYVDGLTTLDNSQQVPLMGEVIDQTEATNGRVVMELDEPDAWTVEKITDLVLKLKAKHVWAQWTFTGTKGALLRLTTVAPHAKVMYRLDNDETLTYAMAEKYGIDTLAVGESFTITRVARWRKHGYAVWGRQTDSASYAQMYTNGIRTLQTGTPPQWLSFCKEQ